MYLRTADTTERKAFNLDERCAEIIGNDDIESTHFASAAVFSDYANVAVDPRRQPAPDCDPPISERQVEGVGGFIIADEIQSGASCNIQKRRVDSIFLQVVAKFRRELAQSDCFFIA